MCNAFFSPQTVGVIVRLEKEAFKVLTQFGKEVSVSQHAVQLRKTRAVALDHKQVSAPGKEGQKSGFVDLYVCKLKAGQLFLSFFAAIVNLYATVISFGN